MTKRTKERFEDRSLPFFIVGQKRGRRGVEKGTQLYEIRDVKILLYKMTKRDLKAFQDVTNLIRKNKVKGQPKPQGQPHRRQVQRKCQAQSQKQGQAQKSENESQKSQKIQIKNISQSHPQPKVRSLGQVGHSRGHQGQGQSQVQISKSVPVKSKSKKRKRRRKIPRLKVSGKKRKRVLNENGTNVNVKVNVNVNLNVNKKGRGRPKGSFKIKRKGQGQGQFQGQRSMGGVKVKRDGRGRPPKKVKLLNNLNLNKKEALFAVSAVVSSNGEFIKKEEEEDEEMEEEEEGRMILQVSPSKLKEALAESETPTELDQEEPLLDNIVTPSWRVLICRPCLPTLEEESCYEEENLKICELHLEKEMGEKRMRRQFETNMKYTLKKAREDKMARNNEVYSDLKEQTLKNWKFQLKRSRYKTPFKKRVFLDKIDYQSIIDEEEEVKVSQIQGQIGIGHVGHVGKEGSPRSTDGDDDVENKEPNSIDINLNVNHDLNDLDLDLDIDLNLQSSAK